MKGWTDGCGFTDGWLKVVEEVPIPLESWLVFTMIATKIFELSVFHPETGTETCFKKADVIVLDDSVYGDDGLHTKKFWISVKLI
ncbi:putative REM family protein [Helianthus annuus]|nr:putative REM family protein [Helianthus annuus]